MDEAKPFISFEELKVEDLSAVWDRIDLDTMGRVLRAHLVVEHFMNEALAAEGVELTRLKKGGVRVTFDNKRKLLGQRGAMGVLSDGINALNAIRNCFAHDPTHQLVTDQTVKFNDPGGHFQKYLKEYCRARSIGIPSAIEIVEAFAESAAGLLLMITRVLAKADAQIKLLDQQRIKLEAQSELLAAMRADDEDDPPSSP